MASEGKVRPTRCSCVAVRLSEIIESDIGHVNFILVKRLRADNVKARPEFTG